MGNRRSVSPYIPLTTLAILLLGLGGLGYLGFLAFVEGILVPGQFAAYGLVITTVAAATASFFSPCSFTVLPSYLAFASTGRDGVSFSVAPGETLGVVGESGCRFHPRCPFVMPHCSEEEPVLKEAAPDHLVACYLH